VKKTLEQELKEVRPTRLGKHASHSGARVDSSRPYVAFFLPFCSSLAK
jgi:hypothetical protein